MAILLPYNPQGSQTPLDGPRTGGPLPPDELVAPPLGGPLPPDPVNNATSTSGPAPSPAPNLSPTPPLDPNSSQAVVQQMLSGFLNPNNPLMANATQAGLELANQRGLINSSIAAGNSRRAALDSVMPLMGQAMDIFNRREGERFQLGRDRSQAQLSNWLSGENHIRSLAAASHQAGLTDWLSNQQYTREFNGALSMLPIVNSFQLSQLLSQYAVQNPQTYPPNVVSGLTNFLNQNMFSILKEYFPNLVVAGSGGTP